MAGLFGNSDMNLGGSVTSQMLHYSAFLPPRYLPFQQQGVRPDFQANLSARRQYYGERASPYKRQVGIALPEHSSYMETQVKAEGRETEGKLDLNGKCMLSHPRASRSLPLD